MSLDFVVLGHNGTPEKTVPIGAALHQELIRSASASGLDRIQVFSEYYEDAEVAVDEVPALVEQIDWLRSRAVSSDLRCFLDEVIGLAEFALAEGRPLHAIAD